MYIFYAVIRYVNALFPWYYLQFFELYEHCPNTSKLP